MAYADGLAWSGREHRITRKYDGEFVGGFKCEVSGVQIVGNAERMVWRAGARWTEQDRKNIERRTSNIEHRTGGFFVLTDVSHLDGTDVSRWTLRQRWAELKKVFSGEHPPGFEASKNGIFLAEEFADGAALARVIEQGGEGICAHGWEAPFGADFYAAKHLETFRCIVTGFVEGAQSVTISEWENIEHQTSNIEHRTAVARGRVPLRGNKLDRVRVGSIIKVEGMGLTPAGRIREPRVCQDTPDSWLVAY